MEDATFFGHLVHQGRLVMEMYKHPTHLGGLTVSIYFDRTTRKERSFSLLKQQWTMQ